MEKIKVLVSAFACDPTKGSEPGVGWHWVLEMSKYFELWVLTVKWDHGWIPDRIAEYFKKYPEDEQKIHFIYYDLREPFIRMKQNLITIRIYYMLWQWKTNRIVRETMEDNGISIYHLLTYGNMIYPVSKYGQKRHFVWGPAGGLEIIESEFSKKYSWKSRAFEWLRRSTVHMQKNSPSFLNHCRNADVILCKTESSLMSIPDRYQDKAIIFTDVAMESRSKRHIVDMISNRERINFIAVGRLDAWRGFDLLIETFARTVKIRADIELCIVGQGDERRHLEELIDKFGAGGYITLIGQVSAEKYNEMMQTCDVVINACLKEGGVTNAFDCMTWGKPLLCIDTGGYTRNLDQNSALVLKRMSTREEMIEELTEGVLKICDPEVRRKYAKGIFDLGSKYTWENKGNQFQSIIMEYLETRRGGVDFG